MNNMLLFRFFKKVSFKTTPIPKMLSKMNKQKQHLIIKKKKITYKSQKTYQMLQMLHVRNFPISFNGRNMSINEK